MIKDNFKVKNNIVLLIILSVLLVIFFSLLFFTKDNSLIKDVKKFVEADIKVVYISSKENYKEYPIELFKKYEINYLYIDSDTKEFIKASYHLPDDCRACPILNLCRNGCRRDRLMTEQNLPGKTYFCKAHLRFFTERRQQILDARSIIIRMRQQYRPQ